ncbi:MAG TPA: polysaccharide deacetylase family protein, partial [Polyangiales bacterium]|nr:polysaccharide deacetylase family protein [Polyangiales bacterium]
SRASSLGLLALCAALAQPGLARAGHPLRVLRATSAAHAAQHPSAQIKPHATPIRMAITVDDLPGGGPEPAGYTHARMVQDIVAALQKHHVQYAMGFVVGSMLDGHPDRQAAIDAWLAAGYQVGSHTYAHSALSEVGLRTYFADIRADEPLLRKLERRAHQHERFFRAPYLDEGASDAERRGLARYLSAHHYHLARASLDFGDWAWADAYNRCEERGDTASQALLSETYVKNAVAYLDWSLAASRQVLGRAAPQVLLLHANLATAKNLDAVLTQYQRAGVRFIPLAEALGDNVYNASYDISGSSVFVQASEKLHRSRPAAAVLPSTLLDAMCQ